MNWIGDLKKEGLIKMKIDLLTIEEVKKLPQEISQCKAHEYFDGYINEENRNCIWWLRSPGYRDITAAFVSSYGSVYRSGNYVNHKFYAVRPVLRIEEESLIKTLPRTKKGYVIYLNTKWNDISEYVGSPCLLKKKCLRNASCFDLESNDYFKSHIKRLIEYWFCYKREQEELKK